MNSDLDDALKMFEEIRRRPPVAQWLWRLGLHDVEVLRHSLLVGAVASVFAYKIGLPKELQQSFLTGALLHDVGKITISPLLLHKTGPLSIKERRELESHAEGGYNILQAEVWGERVLELVHLHHERLDGSGYPKGYRGDQLNQLVRMVAICDVFCALIEERVYRPKPNKPLDILETLTDGLDGELLSFFTRDVAVLGYMAKLRLDQEYAESAVACVH